MSRQIDSRLRRLESAMNPNAGIVVIWGTDADCERQHAEMIAARRVSEGAKLVLVQWTESPEDAPAPHPAGQG